MIFLGKILSWVSGSLVGEIADAYKAKHTATTEQARIAAGVNIARLETQQANRALGGRLTAWVQAAWAAPFILYNWKLIVWDKMLGMGATDALSQDLSALQLRIVAFYFGGAAAVGIVRAIRR